MGPGECNICGSRVRFWSFPRKLRRQAATHGFPHSLDDFETLNHRRYSCPVCFSSDRDRLYKLYVDRFLQPDGVRRVLEFKRPRLTCAAAPISSTALQI